VRRRLILLGVVIVPPDCVRDVVAEEQPELPLDLGQQVGLSNIQLHELLHVALLGQQLPEEHVGLPPGAAAAPGVLAMLDRDVLKSEAVAQRLSPGAMSRVRGEQLHHEGDAPLEPPLLAAVRVVKHGNPGGGAAVARSDRDGVEPIAPAIARSTAHQLNPAVLLGGGAARRGGAEGAAHS